SGHKDDTLVSKFQFNYNISDDLFFRQVLQHRKTDHRRTVFWGGGNILTSADTNPADPGNLHGIYKRLGYRWFESEDDVVSFVGDLAWEPEFKIGNFDLRPITQVGYSYTESDSDGVRRAYTVKEELRYFNLAHPNFNAYENHSDALEDGYTLTQNSISSSNNWNVYINQELKMFEDRLRLLYGWRRAYFDNSFKNRLNGDMTNNEGTAAPSQRYGGSFRVSEKLSFYASGSERNDGTRTVLRFPAGLSPDDPRIGETISADSTIESSDIGIKGRLLENKLYYSLGYFKIQRTGTTTSESRDRETPPGSGNSTIVIETVFTNGDTVKGWEAELIGQLTEKFSVNFSFGTMDSQQPNPTTPDPDDTRPIRFVPDWSANVFAKYNMKDENGDGFGIRGGVSFIGELDRYSLSNFGERPLSETQSVVDFGVDYTFGKYRVDAYVKNAFDDTFMTVRVNTPRQIGVSLSGEF
ncbi:MAG: TonB-dependent receptor, partial [Verrucomicrobia bacterium]|nr:TonB-dependent receptor [Verrucomicrobiota bacterium]